MANTKLTDRELAIKFIHDWIYGATEPHFMDADEMDVSEKRRDRVLKHVDKIMDSFVVRINKLNEKVRAKESKN